MVSATSLPPPKQMLNPVVTKKKVLLATGNILNLPPDILIAHAISSDLALGAGVALQIRNKYPEVITHLNYAGPINTSLGGCVIVATTNGPRIANLITKQHVWHNATSASARLWGPTLSTLATCLLKMRISTIKLFREDIIAGIAFPRIGSGLDRMNIIEVERLIQEVFGETDIPTTIYDYP